MPHCAGVIVLQMANPAPATYTKHSELTGIKIICERDGVKALVYNRKTLLVQKLLLSIHFMFLVSPFGVPLFQGSAGCQQTCETH